ncbi:MAG: efflux RND transporter periplasmic adaptor subunit, partial [Gemmataceae bacterium]|nr:efflux RND transporter periplasmic adaptor subunit [Gemmataceae bacterium]
IQKEVHEANNSLRTAERNEAAQARLLQQGGLDTGLLEKRDRDVDIIMAEVPEQHLGRIALGQPCEARFFGLPGQVFQGKVGSIAPVVSKERRTLRVLLAVQDPRDQLRPGLFADIGLGTEPRHALFVPAESIIHVGDDDYALVRAGERDWRVAPVKLGETHGDELVVESGLTERDEVVGAGAILLKRFILDALEVRP